MWYLYVLKSLRFERNYIGITQDVSKRLSKHNSGDVRSTKAYKPWKLVYKEIFETKTEARVREIRLKRNGFSRRTLFKKIESALSSIG